MNRSAAKNKNLVTYKSHTGRKVKHDATGVSKLTDTPRNEVVIKSLFISKDRHLQIVEYHDIFNKLMYRVQELDHGKVHNVVIKDGKPAAEATFRRIEKKLTGWGA